LRMDQQPLAGPGRSAAENHMREREHAVILVPLTQRELRLNCN
jgi:hypothetical protein